MPKFQPVQKPGEVVGRANADVQVPCCACGRMVYWRSAIIDLEGEPFRSYYHEACVPQMAEVA